MKGAVRIGQRLDPAANGAQAKQPSAAGMTARIAAQTQGCDPGGRRRWCLGAAAVLGLAGCGHLSERRPARAVGGVPRFSAAVVGPGLPAGWQLQVPRPDLPRTRYDVVERDGRRVLHALADRSASGLRCDVDADPCERPWLTWEWRTDTVNLAATVTVAERDDAPLRVAVGFQGDLSTLSVRELLFGDLVEALTGYTMPFATLMYVWDGQAPRESVAAYSRSNRIRYLVVESGAGGTGRWLSYRRNVVDDYRRVFGTAPGRISDVGILTDSDDLKTNSEAWYGDLSFDTGRKNEA